ncbi:MAG: iron-sulfur cluster assembly accessory protein [Coleofasciculus sp. G3-WIS-01]|uniref:HesB/IscA family protein n=1 Tax=Coleofasciculus sp. G3-WIS-01 TaxID=3069528 RepID=UPI0032FFD5A0
MITLSQAATNEIRRLKTKHQQQQARLRLGAKPGGCADLYYTLEFDDAVRASDRVYDTQGITVVVDEASIKYLTNLTLDYSEDLMGGGFRFYNPNAIETCGCGNSFRVKA